MSSPRTGTVPIRRTTSDASVRARSLGLVVAAVRALARTPEITVGALGVVVAAAFSWVPSVWYDEAATIASAQRSWPALWAELQNVDAVHGLYYAVMHVWFTLVGYSPFTLRFPSALAIGVSAGLVVALGRRLGGVRLGVVSGIVFLVLPRVAWAGTEGRPYATVTTFAVALTLVGITAVRRTRTRHHATRWWVVYGLLAVVAVLFNVYLALAVVAHGVVLLWTAVADRAARRDAVLSQRSGPVSAPMVDRAAFVRWGVAAVGAALVVSPFIVLAAGQAKQVGWITGVGWATVRQVVATAWFGAVWPYAVLGWALMIVGVVLAVRATRRPAPAARDLLRMQAVRVAVPLTILPTALLVGATAAGEHLYSPKYASLSLPFVALLIGLAITAIRPRRWLALAVVGMLLVSAPTSTIVRLPHAKQDSHWANAAAIIERERDRRTDQNEGVVFGSVWEHPGTTAQVIADSYPEAFTGMRDLAVAETGAERGQLWNVNGDIATTVPERISGIDTVWFVGGKSRNIRPQVTDTLVAEGFHVVRYWHTGTVILWKYSR
ncbi:glycosyltransferase family 39 protein [Curtobacterium flaccumfaciens pv. flaccumfaciens]|uniref:glycosyltransferase family 39 protein n=1 Tax=Curtobacterium flaccumfaciens TaxID=2035 RepID=UPI00217DC8B6|nr:glycosyltransferase family 39 protein [Curtobacterium flaccumfaciens]MCS6549205.1 glycosyltransferase family 39 protein [Curtobacterium flaccumfaciens pv. flaccumfaciens]